MTGRERAAELLFIGVYCAIAAYGSGFLPADDYQPSRPIYAAGWLVGAIVLLIACKESQAWLVSAAKSLVAIFAFVLLISFLM